MSAFHGAGQLEVGMTFEGRATQRDCHLSDCANYAGHQSRPISNEQYLDSEAMQNLPDGTRLARYGRVFRTVIHIVEEITDHEAVAEIEAAYRAKVCRKNARLGLPEKTTEWLPF